MNALLVVFAKVPEKHLEFTIAADARRQYIPSFAQMGRLSRRQHQRISQTYEKEIGKQ
jgi:hypothetical protein